MKRIKKVLLSTVTLFVFFILFRGLIYRNTVSYHSIDQRKNYKIKDTALINYVEKNNLNESEANISRVIEQSLILTARYLQFTTKPCKSDPNELIHTKKANCIGYAAFFSSSCNYLLQKEQLSNIWKAQPYIGELHFLGVNIHPLFHSPFFADHDFVLIRNLKTNEVIAVDPTVYDYSGIERVRFPRN
ncbi:MAG: hypothetical protein GC181_12780 [Bacteroidetes bacterium]|nr:hypothetical protein [Bacteroidota bacterium]